MEYEDVLTNQPVVIDNGSGVIKADFAGDDQPKCAVEGNVFIERKAQELRGLIKIKYPIEHGIVSIWKYIYEEELKTAPEEHPVLLTEAPFNLRNNKILLHKCFLNVQSPALFTSIQAVLSLYSSGRTTGIVLDSGDGVTHAVPVYEEFSLPYAIRRIDIAGRSGYNFHTTAEKEVVRTIKEKICYVAINPNKEEKDTNREFSDYVLPDGSVVKLKTERFKAPEILFKPELIGEEVDLDLGKSLFANVVLSGESTLYKDFGTRLLNEVRKLAVKDIKIKIYAPQERKYSTWIDDESILVAQEAEENPQH
ncbi:13073_t:CDS:10 [Entrophospora sp. SA101]|nr:13073_t:CDS:10 [Entrophospora sp. SA101]